MTWRSIAFLCLASLAEGCGPFDPPPYWCFAMYPVAPGQHGRFYEGRGEIRVEDSANVESIDSTRLMDIYIYTLGEESNFQLYGISEPRLYIRIASDHPGEPLGCEMFVLVPPEVIELSLDGSDNCFRCHSNPESDAELFLRNEGEGAGIDPFPSIVEAELVGTYTESSGAELYEIQSQSFSGWYHLDCDDPEARR